MLGSLPLTDAVPPSWRLAQRLHINGNAIYNVGSQPFISMLRAVEINAIDASQWQVR